MNVSIHKAAMLAFLLTVGLISTPAATAQGGERRIHILLKDGTVIDIPENQIVSIERISADGRTPLTQLADAPLPIIVDDIQRSIAIGITMLEARQYRQFIETFVEPDQLAKLTRVPAEFDDLVRKFSEDKADNLLQVLRTVSGKTPDVKTETAVEFIKDMDRPLRFTRIGQRWYLRN